MGIQQLQNNIVNGTGTYSPSSPLGVTLTAGTPSNGYLYHDHVLIAAISSYNSSLKDTSVAGISQTGVAWGLQVQNQSSNLQFDVEIWVGIVSGSPASNIITINFNNPQNVAGVTAEVFEYSGLSSVIDIQQITGDFCRAMNSGDSSVQIREQFNMVQLTPMIYW